MRTLAVGTFLALLAAISASVGSSYAQEAPWKRRMRTGVRVDDAWTPGTHATAGAVTPLELHRLGFRPRGAGLVDLSHWPEEPASPAHVSTEELTEAMRQLCPVSVDSRQLRRYASAIIRYSGEFSVDPWLLAALVYTQSKCDADVDNRFGTGLTLINVGMHKHQIANGRYRFGVRTGRGWRRAELDVSAFPFRRDVLRKPEPNLYFAAAFLHVFGRQCPDIDGAFHSATHRHPVSHFVWGDRVADTGPEDRILTARRRLLGSHTQTHWAEANNLGFSLVSPLDGYPRVVTSGLGEPRDHGKRLHRGIDFASQQGEPVRAVAAGKVIFAGVDWERRAQIPLEPWGASLVHARHMGPRGLFVEVDHGQGVVSLYAHLSRYDVKTGDGVEAGQLLGEVGRTGIRESAPHLHFGLFRDGEVLDPLEYLAAYVFPPELTKRRRAELGRLSPETEPAAGTGSPRKARLQAARITRASTR